MSCPLYLLVFMRIGTVGFGPTSPGLPTRLGPTRLLPVSQTPSGSDPPDHPLGPKYPEGVLTLSADEYAERVGLWGPFVAFAPAVV